MAAVGRATGAWNPSRCCSSALSITHSVCRHFLCDSTRDRAVKTLLGAGNIVAMDTIAALIARTALPARRCAEARAPNGKRAAHESGSRAGQASLRPFAIDRSGRYPDGSFSRGGCENNRDASEGHFHRDRPKKTVLFFSTPPHPIHLVFSIPGRSCNDLSGLKKR